jgi:hypothetical protein
MFDPMECLRDHVPLALGIDLLAPDGPDASGIFADEPADLAWTQPLAEQAPEDPATAN